MLFLRPEKTIGTIGGWGGEYRRSRGKRIYYKTKMLHLQRTKNVTLTKTRMSPAAFPYCPAVTCRWYFFYFQKIPSSYFLNKAIYFLKASRDIAKARGKP